MENKTEVQVLSDRVKALENRLEEAGEAIEKTVEVIGLIMEWLRINNSLYFSDPDTFDPRKKWNKKQTSDEHRQ